MNYEMWLANRGITWSLHFDGYQDSSGDILSRSQMNDLSEEWRDENERQSIGGYIDFLMSLECD